jgi:16S rRNA (cytosine967-C5)-methyltransferase
MKLYLNLADAVVGALRQIFEDRKYADKVIEKTLKMNPKWGARDRRFIAETTYDIVRWYRMLQFISQSGPTDYWRLFGAWCVVRDIPLPGWPPLADVDPREVRTRLEQSHSARAIRESIPDWLDEMGQEQLGDRWEAELRAMNQEATVVLRTNTLKTSREELQKTLHEQGVASRALTGRDEALVLQERQNIFRQQAFKDGLFEVQDAASQDIAPFLRVEPGMRVIDACAGAGGKTLHIAALMKNKGRIIGMDVDQAKLQELQKRARRAGVSNLETRVIESSKTIKRLSQTADRLLLDVPCSGLGVLKRNPDAKWKLSPEFVSDVVALQQHILADYCGMLKTGGLLLYSTCSILPNENEKQVQQFLATHSDFSLVNEKRCWPSDGFDGFYLALLQKK